MVAFYIVVLLLAAVIGANSLIPKPPPDPNAAYRAYYAEKYPDIRY